MAKEEIFESSFENDRFLMALEDDNLFRPRQITDLDASQSSENATQYNDENVNADTEPSHVAIPNKLPCTSTLAAAIARLKAQMSKPFSSPPPAYPNSGCEKTEPEVPTSSIKELRKNNEQCVVEKQKPKEKTHISKDQLKSAPPIPPTTTSKSKKSQNRQRKSKVKRLAQKFNSKLSQLMCHESTETKENSVDNESDEEVKVEELHTSKLPVVLKPNPERGSCLPKQRVSPRQLPRKIREQRYINEMKILQGSRKRCIDPVSSMSFDTFGPPRKIHRTWTERLQSTASYREMLMERMFCNWITEKYGVTFDIHSVENSEDSFTNADEANTSKCPVISKSEFCLLFGKAMVKFESVESRVMRRNGTHEALKIINDPREQQNTHKSVEVELPISQIGTSINEKLPQEASNRVQRKVKRQAPQPPTAINEIPEQQDTNKSVVEAKFPISQISISIDEKIPQEPSSRVQGKVKCQAPQPPTAINEIPEQQDTNKSVVEVELPISQAEEPSKRVQGKVKRQAPQPSTAVNEARQQQDTNRGVIASGASNNITSPDGTLQSTIDSFIDLGFETGSNYTESPNRTVAPAITPKQIKSASPPSVKLTPGLDKSRPQNSFSFSSSTPDKSLQNISLPIFSSNTARMIEQEFISPIRTVSGGRRRLWQANDSRQNSPSMQVICEDPLEHVEPSKTANSPILSENSFCSTTFNLIMANNTEHQDKSSKFWVCAVDFKIALDIFYSPPDRLYLLNRIFSQKSCKSQDLYFGIDDQKFSMRNAIEKTDISARLPAVKGCSYYWFCTGELAVPFNGKRLATEKIQRLFSFIKDSMTDNMRLRFGVDNYEFSRASDNKGNSNRFSMLAGPHEKRSGTNSNYSKASNRNVSENGSKIDRKNLHHTLESSRNATAKNSFHNEKIDIETLEKLFQDDAKSLDAKLDRLRLTRTISKMINNLKKVNIDLKELEKRMKMYSNHSGMAKAILPHSKESPLYMQKLRIITCAINSLLSENGFTACSKEQLEGFMLFLTHYAHICLERCNKHMINVLDALVKHHQENIDKANIQLGLAEANGNELKKP
ncbi:uncharacterized protein LOC128862740 [Anastrepha ludens]|uniref:uncharacterized protein LOC128862740 n=1 Tax=Anastrepha ludens TaxID=28586 RepID=UPI0023B1B466|nr:uncharacterized protein LOC128862740 [Anastrepha ludens]